MALSEKWIPLRENDVDDLSDKKHSRGEKPGNRSGFSSGTEWNPEISSALPAPEKMFDLRSAMSWINCNIRAGAFVTIACAVRVMI